MVERRSAASCRVATCSSLYPHQTRYVVPAAAVHVLPDDVPPARAVLAANLETAINGLWDARPHIGDRIAVVGAGTVGCLVAWLAGRIHGCDVELVDINPRRAAIAGALGVRFAPPEAASDGADVVIHASGSPAGLELALRVAGFEATIVEMSWYGDQAVPLRARRGVSRAAADAQVVAGRQRRAVAARALGHRGGGCSSRWRCSPTRRSTCSSPARAPSRALPQVMAELADGAARRAVPSDSI